MTDWAFWYYLISSVWNILFPAFQIARSHFSMAWWQHKNMYCLKFNDLLGIRNWVEYLTIILFSVIAQKLYWVCDCNVPKFYQFLPLSQLFNIWLVKFLSGSLLFWVICIHRSNAALPPLEGPYCNCLIIYCPVAWQFLTFSEHTIVSRWQIILCVLFCHPSSLLPRTISQSYFEPYKSLYSPGSIDE